MALMVLFLCMDKQDQVKLIQCLEITQKKLENKERKELCNRRKVDIDLEAEILQKEKVLQAHILLMVENLFRVIDAYFQDHLDKWLQNHQSK